MQKNTDVYEVTSILLTDERGGGVIYVGYMHINKDGGAKTSGSVQHCQQFAPTNRKADEYSRQLNIQSCLLYTSPSPRD